MDYADFNVDHEYEMIVRYFCEYLILLVLGQDVRQRNQQELESE